MKQIREEIKVGFMAHESFAKMRFLVMEVVDQQQDEHIAALEWVTSALDKSLTGWKPEVDSFLTAAELQLTKLNSYFNRDGTPKHGVLPHGWATERSSAGLPVNSPAGHCFDTNYRDCVPERVFTLIHDSVIGVNHHLLISTLFIDLTLSEFHILMILKLGFSWATYLK
jgi:hypothetical protein